MTEQNEIAWGRLALGVAALLVILAIGVNLRLDEVAQTSALPAEDPYNHLALTRNHLEDGNVAPLYEGSVLYPAGMHALLAAYHAYTGIDLHEVFRFGPVLFGALGIVGMALLLWRYEGALAGVVGGLAYAIAPEVIFRTTMMAPTAIDLALLPFFLYTLLRLVQGGMGWAVPAGATALYIVFAHPWLLSLMVAAGAVFLVGVFLFRWPAARGRPVDLIGLAAASAIIGVSWGLSLTGCWGTCGGGLGIVTKEGGQLGTLAPILAGITLLVAAGIAARPGFLVRLVERGKPRPKSVAARLALGLLLGGGFLAVTLVALEGGLPPHVDLFRMFGWPILVLGVLGLVLLPFALGPASLMGAAIAISSYPFVVFNPFDSPFWSHRTAVFLGVGFIILLGAVVRLLLITVQAVRDRLAEGQAAPMTRRLDARPAFGVVVALLVTVPLAGAVYVATPEPYPEGWYRLFEPCGSDGLQAVGSLAADDPDAIIVTGSWQAKLVVAAHAPNATRVWFEEDFFTSAERRNGVLQYADAEDRTLVAVVDKYLVQNHPELDLSYFQDRPWYAAGSWCVDSPSALHAYANEEGVTA